MRSPHHGYISTIINVDITEPYIKGFVQDFLFKFMYVGCTISG